MCLYVIKSVYIYIYMYNVIRTRKNKLFIHLKFLTNYI